MKVPLPLDGTARQKVRGTSKAVFGGAYVLEAVLVMSQHDRFYAGQLVALTGCEGSYATSLLRKFGEARLIEELSREDGQARKYYRRLPAPLWDFAIEWAVVLLEPPDADVARLSA